MDRKRFVYSKESDIE